MAKRLLVKSSQIFSGLKKLLDEVNKIFIRSNRILIIIFTDSRGEDAHVHEPYQMLSQHLEFHLEFTIFSLQIA